MTDTRNTFMKMKNGKWGVKIPNTSMPTIGETIVIEKRNGDTVLGTIATVEWFGIARNGQPGALVTIVRESRRSANRAYDAGRDEYKSDADDRSADEAVYSDW